MRKPLNDRQFYLSPSDANCDVFDIGLDILLLVLSRKHREEVLLMKSRIKPIQMVEAHLFVALHNALTLDESEKKTYIVRSIERIKNYVESLVKLEMWEDDNGL